MDDILFSSNSELWETPADFFEALDEEFKFTLDACAIPENAKCEKYFTPDINGLDQEWTGVVWCNPPYGREVNKWVKKAAESARGGRQLLCYCRPAQIQNGSMNIYTTKPKSDL